jgi:hypothetical protein
MTEEQRRDLEYEARKQERRKGVPPLLPWPTTAREALTATRGFHSELAFFVPLAANWADSAASFADAAIETPLQQRILLGVATLLRVCAQPACGSNFLGSVNSEFECRTVYDDSHNGKQRDKVDIFFYWMVRDMATRDADNNEQRLLRPGNVVGILVRALAVDPNYSFDDALDVTLAENEITLAPQRARSIESARHVIKRMFSDAWDVNKELQPQFSGSELLSFVLSPERYQQPLRAWAEARYRARAELEYQHQLARAVRKYNDKRRSAFELRKQRPADANNGGGDAAEPEPDYEDVSAAELPDDQKEEARKRTEEQLPRHKAAEMRLLDKLGFEARECTLAMRATAGSVRDVTLLSPNLPAHNCTLPLNSKARNTMATVGFVVASYELFVATAMHSLQPLGLSSELVAAARRASSAERRFASLNADEQRLLSLPRFFTLDLALKVARWNGACESLLVLDEYYEQSSLPFNPAAAAQPVPFCHAPVWPTRQMREGAPPPVLEPAELDDSKAAPYRAAHPVPELVSVVPMKNATLAAMEQWQFPWTVSTLPAQLEDALREARAMTASESADLEGFLELVSAAVRRVRNGDDAAEDDSESPLPAAVLDAARLLAADQQRVEQIADAVAAARVASNIDAAAGTNDPMALDGGGGADARASAEQLLSASVHTASDYLSFMQARDSRQASRNANDPSAALMINSRHEANTDGDMLRCNFDHVREQLTPLYSRWRMLYLLSPERFEHLTATFRRHCMMTVARVYNSGAMNNGNVMRALLRYERTEMQTGAFIQVRAISPSLSRLGNRMATDLLALRASLGIVAGHQIMHLMLSCVRPVAMDNWAPSKIHLWWISASSQGKTYNSRRIIECSVEPSVLLMNQSSQQAGLDADAADFEIHMSDEAPFTVTHASVPRDPQEAAKLNSLRTQLSEGIVAVERSDRGKGTIRTFVSNKITRFYCSNFCKLPYSGDMSVPWRMHIVFFSTVNDTREALFLRQFAPVTTVRECAASSVKRMFRVNQVLCGIAAQLVSGYALPQPDITLAAMYGPYVTRRCDALMPRMTDYVRAMGRIGTRAYGWVYYRATDLMFNSPLSPFLPRAHDNNPFRPFDITQLASLAPHMFATRELFVWSLMYALKEFFPEEAHRMMYALAVAYGGFRPQQFAQLFAFGGRDCCVHLNTGMHTMELDRDGRLPIFGTEPEHYDRESLEQMPEFWRWEQWVYESLGRSGPLMAHQALEKSADGIQPWFPEVEGGDMVDPNYIQVRIVGANDVSNKIKQLLDSLAPTSLTNVDFVRDFLSERANVTCALPWLKTTSRKNPVLQWDTVRPGHVRIKSVPVFTFDKTRKRLLIHTVFLYLAQPRFMKMAMLTSMEDDFVPAAGETVVLPEPVPLDSVLCQTFTFRRRPGHFLTMENPFFENETRIRAGLHVVQEQSSQRMLIENQSLRAAAARDDTRNALPTQLALEAADSMLWERTQRQAAERANANAAHWGTETSLFRLHATKPLITFNKRSLQSEAYRYYCEREGLSLAVCLQNDPETIEDDLRRAEQLRLHFANEMALMMADSRHREATAQARERLEYEQKQWLLLDTANDTQDLDALDGDDASAPAAAADGAAPGGTRRQKQQRAVLSREARLREQVQRQREARDELARLEAQRCDDEATLAAQASRVIVADYPNQLRHAIPPWMTSDKLERERWQFEKNARDQDRLPNDDSAYAGGDEQAARALAEADDARERAISARLDQHLDSLENTESSQSALAAINHHTTARTTGRVAQRSRATAADPEELRQQETRRRAALAPVATGGHQGPVDVMDAVVVPPRASTSMPPPLHPATRRTGGDPPSLEYARETERVRRFKPPARTAGAAATATATHNGGGSSSSREAAPPRKRAAAVVDSDYASDDMNDYHSGVHSQAFDA